MALTDLNPGAAVCSLLVLLCLHTVAGMSGWAGCLDGQDVFATVKENSPPGEVIAELMADSTMEGVRWSLSGEDADWFFLDGRSIRLNTSADKILDREALGPIIMAELSCNEEDILQSVYRIMVEIVNENDNSPVFAENTVYSLIVSELTAVNTVVFTIKATDADDDKIIYSIDQASPDAQYFRIDLPNSGEVVLSKPLDYETKTLLTVTIYATEMNTAEHFSISTNITITVLDGDDQYPQFLPCMLLFQDDTSRICTSPVYTVNVTEGVEDIVLDFSPGPIHAVDGDRGLRSPVSYAILSGDDEGRFSMDRETGEVRLTQGVTDRLTTPALQLQVMAYQDNDPRKYSVATVLVRVLAVNQFYPEFDMAEYHGFVNAGKSPASLVNTYGGTALMLRVRDQDFIHGFNPMMDFTLSSTCNHTDIYQVTKEGLLIARTSQLKPKQKHVLEVTAVDPESGDATFATVVVEVLSEGQSSKTAHLNTHTSLNADEPADWNKLFVCLSVYTAVPYSPLGSDRLTGCTVGKALFLCMVFMTIIGCVLSMVMWLKRKHKGTRDPLQRGCVAQGKHPNVSLRWFQLVSHQTAMPHMEEASYSNEEYGTCNPSFSLPDQPGVYTYQDLPSCRGPVPPRTTAVPDTSFMPTEPVCSPVTFNNNASTPTKSSTNSPTFHPATVDTRSTQMAQDAAQLKENSDSPPHMTLVINETQSTPSPCPATSLICPDSQMTTDDDLVDPVTSPSSQCSLPCSQSRIASAEIDKPLHKPCVKTPSYSPLLSTPVPKQTSTPPTTPEQAPLKATLVHIDTSPPDTPPETPEQTPVTLSAELDQPSTSLDQTGNTQEGRGAGDEDDDGFLGDEDADKNSDDELEPDEEELLRVMARCNPIFITFSK